MAILITGNMGYIGPVVADHLRRVRPGTSLAGFDSGYFATCLLDPRALPERILQAQYFGDLRSFPATLLDGVEAIVHLGAISNDPMGKEFEAVTDDINHRASLRLAEMARAKGVRRFVFASSCSVYGAAAAEARTESAELNPLTAYARSKVATEEGLRRLAAPDFIVSCLRFSTACGPSPRLRLDLVLNDFVANALSTGKIVILSDGTPWRPLIDVRDMARAFEWALGRDAADGGNCVVVNVGANHANYQVRDLAEAVRHAMPQVEVQISKDALPDKRSYKVDFSHFRRLAPQHQPQCSLDDSVQGLLTILRAAEFNDPKFRESQFIRLNFLRQLRQAGQLNDTLKWNDRSAP